MKVVLKVKQYYNIKREKVKNNIIRNKRDGVCATLALNHPLNFTFYHIISNTSSLIYHNNSSKLLSPNPASVAKTLSAITTKLNTPIK